MPALGQEKFDRNRREAYLTLLREGQGRYAAARQVGLHPYTVTRYRKNHPAFADDETVAEVEAHEQVEDALFQAAASGNVQAAIFYLTNRRPGRWRQRIDGHVEVSGHVGVSAAEQGQFVRSVLSNQQAIDHGLAMLDAVAEADPEARSTASGRVVDVESSPVHRAG